MIGQGLKRFGWQLADEGDGGGCRENVEIFAERFPDNLLRPLLIAVIIPPLVGCGQEVELYAEGRFENNVALTSQCDLIWEREIR